MTQFVFVVATISAAHAGMAALCLSMERHYKQVFQRAPHLSIQRLLRGSGWLLLALALAYSIETWGAALGPVAWFGVLTAVTGMWIFLLSYQERIALAIAAASLALSLLYPLYLASH